MIMTKKELLMKTNDVHELLKSMHRGFAGHDGCCLVNLICIDEDLDGAVVGTPSEVSKAIISSCEKSKLLRRAIMLSIPVLLAEDLLKDAEGEG